MPTCAAVKDRSETSPSCHSAAAAADHRYYMGGTSMSNGTVFWKQSRTVCVLSRDFGFNVHKLWSRCYGIFSKRLSGGCCETQKNVFLLVRFSYVAYFATRSKVQCENNPASRRRDTKRDTDRVDKWSGVWLGDRLKTFPHYSASERLKTTAHAWSLAKSIYHTGTFVSAWMKTCLKDAAVLDWIKLSQQIWLCWLTQ